MRTPEEYEARAALFPANEVQEHAAQRSAILALAASLSQLARVQALVALKPEYAAAGRAKVTQELERIAQRSE